MDAAIVPPGGALSVKETQMTGNDSYFDLIHNFVEELSYASTGSPEDDAVEKRVEQLTPIIDDAHIAYLAVQFIRALWHHDYSVADGCAGDLAGFLLDGLKRTSAAAQDVLDHPLDMTKAVKLVDMVIGDALCGPEFNSSLIAEIWMHARRRNRSSELAHQSLDKAPDASGEVQPVPAETIESWAH